MSDQDQDLIPVVPGLEVAEGTPARETKPLPDKATLPDAIMSGTTGEGLAIGVGFAVKREKDKDTDKFVRATDKAGNVLPARCAGYVVPISGGAATPSPANRFGLYRATDLSPALIRLILANPDEASAMADYLEEHAG